MRPFRTKTYTPPKSASLGRRYSGRGRRRNPCRETPPKGKGKEGRNHLIAFLLPSCSLCAHSGGEKEEEKEASIEKGGKRVLPVPLFLSSLFGGISCFVGPPTPQQRSLAISPPFEDKCMWRHSLYKPRPKSSTLDFPIFLQQRRDNIFFLLFLRCSEGAAVCYSFSPPCLLPGWAARQRKKY